jgi:protein subunit release factor A
MEVFVTKRIIEIRAAEGGIDARFFVAELGKAYFALAHREG